MVSRSCRARFPASHGSLYAAVYSRQLSRILACLAALARLGVTPRFARPKHLASLGRVTALPRFARPGLALQVVVPHPWQAELGTYQVAAKIGRHLISKTSAPSFELGYTIPKLWQICFQMASFGHFSVRIWINPFWKSPKLVRRSVWYNSLCAEWTLGMAGRAGTAGTRSNHYIRSFLEFLALKQLYS